MMRYPSAIAGLFTVVFLVGLAIYAMIAIPYSQAIILWRGGEDIWYQNPKFAAPAWFNNFTKLKQPVSFVMKEGDPGIEKIVVPGEQDTSRITITYTFDFSYDAFPQEILLYFNAKYNERFK